MHATPKTCSDKTCFRFIIISNEDGADLKDCSHYEQGKCILMVGRTDVNWGVKTSWKGKN